MNKFKKGDSPMMNIKKLRRFSPTAGQLIEALKTVPKDYKVLMEGREEFYFHVDDVNREVVLDETMLFPLYDEREIITWIYDSGLLTRVLAL